MFEHKTKILLILSQDVLDRARVVAGKATTALKLPVSLQIVLRALIEEGLKRADHPALVANIERQARTVRQRRGAARKVDGTQALGGPRGDASGKRTTTTRR